MESLRYFTWAFAFTALGLALGGWFGYVSTGTIAGALSVFVICCVLSILEISLSFDNAIVNARILRNMTPVWQRRFLTWGIIIAVFGMRLVFPVAIVSIAASIDPIGAIRLALAEPDEYSRIMHEAHTGIAAFGGTFLLMVGLKYFTDAEKDVHWWRAVESRISKVSTVQGVEIAIVLILILGFSSQLAPDEAQTFLVAAIYGLLTFLLVEGLGRALDASRQQVDTVHKGGLGAFLYLEVLDASFSFDGVIGAFAITTNLVVIAIGLGIGAVYVRSMTIMLVERRTLAHYRYLEHGAFYAIIVLAIIMYCQTLVHIPELVTGLIGAALILTALWSSIRHRRREEAENGAGLASGTAE